MLSPNETIKAYVHYRIIAIVLASTSGINDARASMMAYNKVSAFGHVLQLPYSLQCKGLTEEGLNLYCENAARFYCNLHCAGYELQSYFKTLDLQNLYDLYKINTCNK